MKAHIATAMLVAALAAAVLCKQQEIAAPQPQDPIYQRLDAVRDGSVTNYIDAHTGSMKASLLRAAAEVGEARLLQSLRDQNASLKGIAILQPDPLSDREVKVRVEYIFADRNEIQSYYLEKAGNTWKIARVDGAQRIQTLVAYGTPVN
jgi:hypothetical protein